MIPRPKHLGCGRTKRPQVTDIRILTNCADCHNQLPENNKHHFLCQHCWEVRQIKKGNWALIGGVK